MEGKTNGLQIAGFVVSLVTCFIFGFYGLSGVVGIVLSAIGRSKAKEVGGATGLEVRHVKQNRLTDFQGLSSRIGYLDHLQILLQISIRKERQSPSAPPF